MFSFFRRYQPGDVVRITRGEHAGREARVTEIVSDESGTAYLVNFDQCCSATIRRRDCRRVAKAA